MKPKKKHAPTPQSETKPESTGKKPKRKVIEKPPVEAPVIAEPPASKAPEERPSLFNIMQLSVLLELERRTVSERLQTERTPFQEGPRNSKLYKMSDVFQSFTNKTHDGQEASDTITSQLRAEELKIAKLKRERAEIDLANKRGDYIAVESVLKEVMTEYTTIRTKLLSLPARLSRHLANIADPEEINQMITDAIDETLEELKSDAIKELSKLTDSLADEASDDESRENDTVEASKRESADSKTEDPTQPG
ncbi:MAG: DUF1441 family protein [Bdellovibrionales bacterium]|jgi:hypothetical protein|nr:DUF1441 family protein [Bdellovibrionales bacterium]